MIVRVAESQDIPWIAGELKTFSGEIKSPYPSTDKEAHTFLQNMLDHHVIFVAEKNGVPAGVIGGLISPHLYNKDVHILSEIFWWVIPEHRKSRAGLLLLNAFTKFGREVAQIVTISKTNLSPINDRVLNRRGYDFRESTFAMEVH